MAVDPDKLNAFMGKFVGDLGAGMHAALAVMGDRLGLYKAMAAAGPQTSSELAKKTGTSERYLREWLNAMAAGGYVSYDGAGNKYFLNDEQAFTLADETSPAYLPGAFQVISAVFASAPKIADAFKSGSGVGWHEHHPDLFVGTERFFRPNYAANLVTNWIPALEGIEAKLKKGGKIADVGCGHGSSSILMAQAYPNSEVVGFDYHPASIETAKERARGAGVGNRTRFEVASAKSFAGQGYDLVTFFDCLHDMGDPAGAAKHVHQSLAQDGSWMVVEPMAGDTVESNLNPVGRVFYSASTMICCPASKAQEVGLALGAQAGEKRLTEVIKSGGFKHVRRAAETPFNLILEARR
ncbi:MAG TPA: methyltransferase domain-containing protein [Verrucomicrobiae bacterium]|nr:methyltransferase domain-containing protein [Verrucomicrobiae bacterium]